MSYIKNSAGGKILNITQVIINESTSNSTPTKVDWIPTIPNTGTAAQYFGLTVSPLSANSKILFTGFVSASLSVDQGLFMYLLKDGSHITEANGITTGTSRANAHSGIGYVETQSMASLPINYLMTPGSTTPFEFHVGLRHRSGSTQTIYINETAEQANDGKFNRPVSVFTAMEFLS
tara:strand:+ start:1203 stop:1733 length:531 start_codon:yes stop_codon:yes gene_type:complete